VLQDKTMDERSLAQLLARPAGEPTLPHCAALRCAALRCAALQCTPALTLPPACCARSPARTTALVSAACASPASRREPETGWAAEIGEAVRRLASADADGLLRLTPAALALVDPMFALCVPQRFRRAQTLNL
jgi:hypothetical protein